jgi:Helix-turn-helix domain
MSVEAISWALNLAPTLLDPSGKPSTPCAFVLVGLANHAGPDGTGAFPSTHTLMRYTRLSKRTVQAALDRLEEAGIISPCRPEIIAAHIHHGGYRPQGWDLNLTLLRTDLTEQDITSLERVFPGLRDRITAGQAGVQPLHPSPEDMAGAQPAHAGVQPAHTRGATTAPEPYIEPPIENQDSLRSSSTSQLAALAGDGDEYAAFTAFMAAYPPVKSMPDQQRIRLAFTKALRLAPATEIVTAAARYADAMKTRDPGKVRSPAAWLDKRMWEDDPYQPGIDEPASRPDADRLCEHLADRLEQSQGRRPTVPNEWRAAARRMLDIDGLSEKQAMTAIDWSQNHPFWSTVILSMPKLREKLDTMRKQWMRDAERERQANGNGYRQPTTDARVASALEVAARYRAEEERAALQAAAN